MRSLKLVLLVVVAITGLALGTGVGASAGKENTSISRGGLHVRDVVLHGGANAYVRMPDRIKRIVRTADTPAFSCAGAATRVNTATAQSCTWGPNYKGAVTCLQVSTSPSVTQTCDVSQTNSTQNNTALIVQVIWSQNPRPDQDGTQIVRLRQTNGSGANNASISQYIKQSKGPGTPDDTEDDNSEPDAPATMSATQNQESHQTVHLRQITATGSNNAAALQFLRQRERASHAALVTQSQNTALRPESCVPEAGSDGLNGVVTVQPDANQCILSNQSSTSGAQNLLLNADYNQLQRARGATSGSQTQGVDSAGGGDIGLRQDSTGLSKILTNQNERLAQRAIDAAALLQDQNGPRKGSGSSQGTNPDDTWQGFQTSTLIQTSTSTSGSATAVPSSGHQSDLLEYFGNTSGDVRATQTASLNGDVTNWGCPPPGTSSDGANHICAAVVKCEQGGGEIGLQAVSSACTVSSACPEGTVFNPKTQQCEPSCDYYCTTIESTPSTPVYAYRR